MFISCFTCGSLTDHRYVHMVDRNVALCVNCYEKYRGVNVRSLGQCWACRKMFKAGELVLTQGRHFCSQCISRILAIKKDIKREPLSFRTEDEIWLEVKLWLMLMEQEERSDACARPN